MYDRIVKKHIDGYKRRNIRRRAKQVHIGRDLKRERERDLCNKIDEEKNIK